MKLRLRQFLDYDDTYSLKGIAMLMIIIGHAFNGYPGTDTGYFYPAWLDCLHMELWAAMGVSIFFFLSGYGMFLALDKRQGSIDLKYVISKVRKLFVPLLVYWCIEIVTLLIFNRQELTTHIFREIFTFSMHPDVENWFFKVYRQSDTAVYNDGNLHSGNAPGRIRTVVVQHHTCFPAWLIGGLPQGTV